MVLPVYVYGMPILRKTAVEIDENYEGLDQLIEDMFETMRASDGVGLAAPQIGKSLRLFLINAEDMDIDDEPDLKDFKRIFINPHITEEWGDKWEFQEGCLSIPLIREEVSRHPNLKIKYYDENWVFHEEEYKGVQARIIQHEYDHLDGKLFVDKINPLRKKLLRGRLNAISKGKADVDYKMIYPKK